MALLGTAFTYTDYLGVDVTNVIFDNIQFPGIRDTLALPDDLPLFAAVDFIEGTAIIASDEIEFGVIARFELNISLGEQISLPGPD